MKRLTKGLVALAVAGVAVDLAFVLALFTRRERLGARHTGELAPAVELAPRTDDHVWLADEHALSTDAALRRRGRWFPRHLLSLQ